MRKIKLKCKHGNTRSISCKLVITNSYSEFPSKKYSDIKVINRSISHVARQLFINDAIPLALTLYCVRHPDT